MNSLAVWVVTCLDFDAFVFAFSTLIYSTPRPPPLPLAAEIRCLSNSWTATINSSVMLFGSARSKKEHKRSIEKKYI